MINRRLTSAEAAARLGVKPATLYAYVSRGILSRRITPSGSTFDPQEVARLARTSRRRSGRAGSPSEPSGGPSIGRDGRPGSRRDEVNDPIFVTELTLIEGGHLFYRGLDAVALSRSRSFEAVAGWLWTGRWADDDLPWRAPVGAVKAVSRVLRSVESTSQPVEKFMLAVAAAALTDQLRHDLSPAAVPIVGKGLLATLVDTLPRVAPPSPSRRRPDRSLSARLWPRLSALPITAARQAVLEAALVLCADHELAPSTLAARVAAAFRADPYAVVSTGLGPASGSWRSGSSGAPSEVERLLAEAEVERP